MRNVLILCDAFPPAFAPRMGYLCKYLHEFGWTSTIITEYLPKNVYTNLEGQDVTYINFYRSKNKIIQQLKYAFVFLADFLFDYKSLIIKRKAEKIIQQKNIDILLSSSYRTFPAFAVYQLKHRHKIPVVMDLRDIIEQYPNNEYISKKLFRSEKINRLVSKILTVKLLRQRNKILKNVNAVTTVSEWHVKILSAYHQNINLIYNGFAPELFYPQIVKNKRFIITYTGRIESQEIKNPALLFEAAEKLSAEKKIDIKNFRLQFYLMDEKSKAIIYTFAKKHNVTDFVDIFDAVQNTEIPKILNSSSVLLLLANQSTGEKSPKGIMGTKLFEYLAIEKPILCVRNDEDCLEKTINSANAGLAASAVEEVEEFILEKFAEWQKNSYTHQPVNQEFVQQFSRKRQAGLFAELFEILG